MSPTKSRNIADLHAAARRRLPLPIYHFLAGGSDDERSLRGNSDAFQDHALVPNVLRDMTAVDTSTEFLGQRVALPLMLSPTGASEVFHPAAEPAIARAAARAGIFYALSSMSTTTLEDVAAVGPGPRIFQLYLLRDRGLIVDILQRAKAAGYDALCITVDVVAHGNRERDLLTGFAVPPKLTLLSWINFALHPRWSLPALRCKFRMANFQPTPEEAHESPAHRVERMFTPATTWDDIEWIIAQWNGPAMIKGVNSPADARTAAKIGAKAIYISNHGGRQLDSCVAPIRQLPRIRDAVGSSLELIVDGGIRRGTDVMKALALGADMCSIGRPYLYGLAAFGEAGVDRAIEIFRKEIERDMRMLGCADIRAITADHVVPNRAIGPVS